MRQPEVPAAYFKARNYYHLWPVVSFVNTFPAPPPPPDFGYIQAPQIPVRRVLTYFTWPSQFHVLVPSTFTVAGVTRVDRKHFGSTIIANPGTKAQIISSAIRCKGYVLTGRLTNAGTVYVGLTNVTSTNGYSLVPGESLAVFFGPGQGKGASVDPRDFYVDAETANDYVDWLFLYEV